MKMFFTKEIIICFLEDLLERITLLNLNLVLIQKTELLPLTFDASILIVAGDKFWIGTQAITTLSSGVPGQKNAGFYGAITGIHIGRNLTLGYAYQGGSINKNIGITNNSHELLLRF